MTRLRCPRDHHEQPLRYDKPGAHALHCLMSLAAVSRVPASAAGGHTPSPACAPSCLPSQILPQSRPQNRALFPEAHLSLRLYSALRLRLHRHSTRDPSGKERVISQPQKCDLLNAQPHLRYQISMQKNVMELPGSGMLRFRDSTHIP
jgi:hypothetical protein